MTRFTSGLFSLVTTLLVIACLFTVTRINAAVPATDTAESVIVAQCLQDLAQRVKVPADEITRIDAVATVWPDAALGMPEPGKFYAQAQVPGWRIVLEARGTRYLYTASAHTCRFGGPLALWDDSMLYVHPVPNEPNMNGDLYQCSLIGTNHVRLVSGVDSYYPQANGMILFTRRTSRSGYDLFAVKASKNEKPKRLYGGFYVGAAAFNEKQDTWAAFVRPGLGGGWQVVVARVGHDDNANTRKLPLPDGVRPGGIAWSGDQLLILNDKGEGAECYAITPKDAASAWEAVPSYTFPGMNRFLLSKSESLEISQVKEANGTPSVEVARVWFTGDRNVVATINGLTLSGYDLLGAGYAFIWGEHDGQTAAYTVQISTGEVTPGFHGACQDIKPFTYPPITKP